MTNTPIFVVGMNGSGTSILTRCIGQHSEIYAFAWESKFYTTFANSLSRYGDLSIDENYLKLWHDVAELPKIRLRAGPVSPPPYWTDDDRTFASAVNSVFLECAKRDQGKQRWCEKTPLNGLHMQELAQAFKGSVFIHIIRDGRACSNSLHRRFGRTPEMSMVRWRNVVRAITKSTEELPNRVLTVHFEEFIQSPKTVIQRVCQFLSIDYQEAMVNAQWSSDRLQQTHLVNPHISDWRVTLNPNIIDRLESIAGKTLDEHGYSVSTQAIDRDPPKIKMLFWTAKDYGSQFMREFVDQISGKGYFTWSEYIRYLRTSVQQVLFNRNK